MGPILTRKCLNFFTYVEWQIFQISQWIWFYILNEYCIGYELEDQIGSFDDKNLKLPILMQMYF
jgi:hypothetical protein